MREIKDLGVKKISNCSRAYRYALFECPVCGGHIEKIRKDGIKANSCSHACYAKVREKRGAYKDCVIISGYRYIYSPDHPNATHHNYMAEHRLIAEQKIGRYLNDDEVVHHINLNKLDNRPGNLMILSNSEHSKIHSSIIPICKR